MGRKIPGRKHRGVRDPEKQRLDRLEQLKDKINAPPPDHDKQEIPKSLLRVMELKEKVKSGEIPLKKASHKSKKKSAPVHFKPSQPGLGNDGPVYSQAAGETDRSFMQRVNQVVHDVFKETAFSEKYQVDIKRNQQTGEVEKVEKRAKDPLDLFIDQLKKNKKRVGKKKNATKVAVDSYHEEKVSKSQKKVKKLKVKKEMKDKDLIEDKVEVRHEHLQFGEVAHAPPSLVIPGRSEKMSLPTKPGSKDLLLKNVLKGAHLKVKVPPIPTNDGSDWMRRAQAENRAINKAGKRRNLPIALRRQLDNQQVVIIQAYKELKKSKLEDLRQ